LGVEKRMDKTGKITLAGFIIGMILFLGFYLSSLYNFSIIGIPPLEEFIAMVGVLLFIISGFFYLSYKTMNQ
jgi:CHASE3 domain sensor protein